MKSIIAIKCMRQVGVVTTKMVDAEVFGDWAVHKSVKPCTGYTITYVPMGMAIGLSKGCAKHACVRAARALNESDLKPKTKAEPALTRWFTKNGLAVAALAWSQLCGASK